MAKNKKTGLTTKHWLGYMCGDWGGCMTFTKKLRLHGFLTAVFPAMTAVHGIRATFGIGLELLRTAGVPLRKRILLSPIL